MANHVLICGMTASGKSYAAKRLAARALARGKSVLVFDPLRDSFPATWRTANLDALLTAAKRSRNCLIIIDEALTNIGLGVGEKAKFLWLATMSRHCGHQVVFICQRLRGLSPTIRDNCRTLFLFSVHKESAEIVAEAFNDDGLRRAPELPAFHFFYKEFFKPLRICKF